ncbi:DNA repair protein RecO [Prochlorococcus sp. MIT 1307]|uniref:DNA repair protein RecO n=1 Tax=Prochlorococcus sp. MIT 1307 TaxID=3096219 RepID=UPI002A74CC28|nr:DNA repair protein RecO [Prochlorococcus sp. MIT 1307]
MSFEQRIQGLSLKVGPLGENDRLLTILTNEKGVTRVAVPGARKPKSNFAAAAPFTFLDLQLGGRAELKRVRDVKVLRSYTKVGQQLETLAAAQALAELSLLLVANNDPIPGMLSTVLIHLERLIESEKNGETNSILTLAKSVQSCVHLLALGGYGLPIQNCCHSGLQLDPPIGKWDWRCSFIPEEGFAIGSIPNSAIQLNPSEFALLQRLLRPNLPKRKDGELMGPKEVWIRLLIVVENWINNHLPRNSSALKMLRESLLD